MNIKILNDFLLKWLYVHIASESTANYAFKQELVLNPAEYVQIGSVPTIG